MSVCLVMATYERPDLLATVLSKLLEQRPAVDLVEIIDDGSSDPRVRSVISEFGLRWQAHGGCPLRTEYKQANGGAAALYNEALGRLFRRDGFDHVAIADSDIVASPADWPLRLVSFLSAHPEAGVAAPDKPGCYLRLRRNGYDEVEWVVSIAYAIPRRAFLAATEEGPWCDPDLATIWDCDICLRLRMLGYRVAVVPDVRVTDLGEGRSTVSGNLARSNFLFNRKWNRRFLGRFLYKSRGMFLRFEDYPPNALFRRLVNAQQGEWSVAPAGRELSRHRADSVSQLACAGNMPTREELLGFLEADLFVPREQGEGDVDPALLAGRRQFDLAVDASPFSLKRTDAA